ncbi:MAG: cyclic nucleotide-binding domain-containing protein [Ignavibacteria bacterium]|nr:cyclic nucleotide-binding domain-containing protein [Ignavibacteria bacterium]
MKTFRQGEFLAREGEMSKTIYILMTGKVGVFKGSLQVAEFEDKGTIFGEMSSILGEKRTASLKAVSDCLVIDFDKGIDAIIDEYPEIAKRIMVNLALHLKKTTKDYYVLANEVITTNFGMDTGKTDSTK